MKRGLSVLIVGLALVTWTAPLVAQPAAGSLKGAWRVVAVTGADGKTDSAPQPGLYIFTDRHYSIQRVTAPRVALPAQNATDKELAAAFGPYTANSGTYELKGATLTTRPMVAKNPNVMTGTAPPPSELRFESPAVVYITSTNPAGGKTVTKLQRLE